MCTGPPVRSGPGSDLLHLQLADGESKEVCTWSPVDTPKRRWLLPSPDHGKGERSSDPSLMCPSACPADLTRHVSGICSNSLGCSDVTGTRSTLLRSSPQGWEESRHKPLYLKSKLPPETAEWDRMTETQPRQGSPQHPHLPAEPWVSVCFPQLPLQEGLAAWTPAECDSPVSGRAFLPSCWLEYGCDGRNKNSHVRPLGRSMHCSQKPARKMFCGSLHARQGCFHRLTDKTERPPI